MTLAEGLTIFALIAGPIVAVQIQKRLDIRREERGRKLWIFKKLMATRASTLSADHVQALNMIDLEFHGEEYRPVTTAWKTYLDHLSSYPKEDEKRQPLWAEKNIELLSSLLMVMGSSLGYEFDEVHVKKGIYAPVGHGRLEDENSAMRRGLLEVLSGSSALKMEITGVTNRELVEAQQALLGAILKIVERVERLEKRHEVSAR